VQTTPIGIICARFNLFNLKKLNFTKHTHWCATATQIKLDRTMQKPVFDHRSVIGGALCASHFDILAIADRVDPTPSILKLPKKRCVRAVL
jgi:hypothetical protein